MKKVFLSVVGFSLLCRLNVHAQSATDTLPKLTHASEYRAVDTGTSTTSYSPRALHVDEINLVSSYYLQDGNHSAVTGGIGTEHVTDIANALNINLVWLNEKLNKNTLSLGFGFDYHTAASQAWVSATGA